jgi:hypothetical protein
LLAEVALLAAALIEPFGYRGTVRLWGLANAGKVRAMSSTARRRYSPGRTSSCPAKAVMMSAAT